MLRVGVIFLLLIATCACYPYYNPLCRGGCVQQPTCGGVSSCSQFSQCCNGFNGGYGGINYPVAPVGYPGIFSHAQPPVYPVYPNYPVYHNNPAYPTYPVVPTNGEPLKIVVDTSSSREWICPVDPQPRAAGGDLVECNVDENCVSNPTRQKCCSDQGVGKKVCKPAVQAY